METRVPDRHLLIIPVGFAVIAAVLAAFTWIGFHGTLPFAPAGYQVVADFPQASNLYGGDDVRIAGINVGEVRAVQRVRDGARVTMQLQPAYVPLHAGAEAILRTKTLLGEAYIELSPGSVDAPAIPDGGQLAPGHVLAAQQLSDVLSTYNPQTRRQLQRLLAGLAAAARGRGTDLNQAIGSSAPAMADFNTVLQTLNGQRGNLAQLLGSAGDLLTTVGSEQGALQAAITAGNQALGVTAARAASLRAMLRAFPPFLSALRTTTATAGAASGDLNSAVTALAPVAPRVAGALSASTALSTQLRALFRATPSLTRAGERGLPAGTAIVRAAAPLVRQLYPAAQQLTPVVQLADVVRNSIVAAFANVASVGEGSQPGADGSDPHYLAATTLVWNEALGGYQKRLPSNRQNPYPAPNSELDIAHGGLKAYDCRNIDNPDIVPPALIFGGSAPPCVTQGPWTFDGVSAYFPRLQPAMP